MQQPLLKLFMVVLPFAAAGGASKSVRDALKSFCNDQTSIFDLQRKGSDPNTPFEMMQAIGDVQAAQTALIEKVEALSRSSELPT